MRNKRKLIYGILTALSFVAIILGIILSSNQKIWGLKVVFLNVGQGDAILVSQGNTQLLIDGGRDGKTLLAELGKYVPFWDRTIELVMVTHPDQDHIGGLAQLAKTYRIETVLETQKKSTSQAYKHWEELLGNKKVSKIEAKKGVVVRMPKGGELEILHPLKSVSETDGGDSNANSVVARLSYGGNEFLFTGDLPIEAEGGLMQSGQNLRADFLKVSHHGSKYATSDEFLEVVKPQAAIISVGKNNSYGHPNEEVLQRLRKRAVEILRTDERGDIVYECANLERECLLLDGR